MWLIQPRSHQHCLSSATLPADYPSSSPLPTLQTGPSNHLRAEVIKRAHPQIPTITAGCHLIPSAHTHTPSPLLLLCLTCVQSVLNAFSYALPPFLQGSLAGNFPLSNLHQQFLLLYWTMPGSTYKYAYFFNQDKNKTKTKNSLGSQLPCSRVSQPPRYLVPAIPTFGTGHLMEFFPHSVQVTNRRQHK